MKKIFKEIERVTGFNDWDLRCPDRHRHLFYARLLFIKEALKEDIKDCELARILNKDQSTIYHYKRRLNDNHDKIFYSWENIMNIKNPINLKAYEIRKTKSYR